MVPSVADPRRTASPKLRPRGAWGPRALGWEAPQWPLQPDTWPLLATLRASSPCSLSITTCCRDARVPPSTGPGPGEGRTEQALEVGTGDWGCLSPGVSTSVLQFQASSPSSPPLSEFSPTSRLCRPHPHNAWPGRLPLLLWLLFRVGSKNTHVCACVCLCVCPCVSVYLLCACLHT